jgi:hypothetical protein
MSANTLASALAAARKSSPSPAAPMQPTRAIPLPAAPIRQPAAPALPQLSHVDALMIAVQRSAGTVDNIVTRRMLLASGCWGQPGTK